ncbi:radical SAM protein [bacterium]|nr:radical SAM protein [bacterium]
MKPSNLRQMMQYKLIYPPQWNPMNPHFSLYTLGGFMRSRGLNYQPYDLNVEFFRTILSVKYLDYSLGRARNARDFLKMRVQMGLLCRERTTEFGALCARFLELQKYLGPQRRMWYSVRKALPEAVSVFGDKEKFYDPVRLLRAYITIDKALDLISLPYYPSRLRFNDFSAPSQPLTVEGLIKFTADRDDNIFMPFMEMKAAELARELRASGDMFIVGISINSHSQLYGGLTLARLLRDMHLPNAHISLGGNYFMRLWEALLLKPRFMECFADSVIWGEGELPLLALYRALEEGRPLNEVPNLLYRDDSGNVVFNAGVEPLPLAERAAPCLDGLDLSRYFTPEIVISTRTSKGCYWQKCTFCDSDYGVKHDTCPVERVLDEWKMLAEEYGIRNFELIDEAMTPTYMAELCRRIVREGLKVNFFGNGRTDKEFTAPIFRTLREGGLTMVLWGLESASERVLKLINKGVDINRRLDILREAHEAGIWNFAYIFFGFPSETEEEAQKTIDMICQNTDIINAYGRSVFTLGKQSKIRCSAKQLGIVDMIADDQEFSTILNYRVTRGMDRQAALRMAERCRQQCIVAYGIPIWMFLRYREVIHLYLKEKGHAFLTDHKLSEAEWAEVRGSFAPAAEKELAYGYVSNDDTLTLEN